MYTLLSGAYRHYFQKDEYCILILGLDDAGKTTFLEQTKTKFSKEYRGMPLNKITTTVGLNIGKITTQGVKLMFWDLGGQEELQSLWDKYFSDCHGVIFIVDSADPDRLLESKRAFDHVLSFSTLDSAPLLILGNKQDISGCLPILEIKHAFHDCSNRIGSRDCMIRPCSGLTGAGVTEGIEWMAKCVKLNPFRPPRRDKR
ncbi:Oidioi.mRNA.OKI2018_I69.PAR.g13212.t1.cds [Oikopleura dioica]|uniref:ADP-ribosylation factor-related protein 1 n=1 Tax=Oikopleura dioica TaxID=34765 RepID=A0ABN7S9V4_OIKDI|nr:Oidioi.mRNA.OKI2018_I69.PAR.g13212.t1.cds [Oikopleura dioica]